MKLLYITPWPPFPLNSGGRIRSAATLNFLRQRHEVQLITFVAGPKERALALAQKAIAVDYMQPPPVSLLPPSLRPFDSENLKQILQAMSCQGFEATLFDHIYSSQHWSLACGIPVLQEHNIESEAMTRIAAFQPLDLKRRTMAEALALRAYEQKIWPEFPLRTCVSERDASTMRQRCSKGRTVVVPNGVEIVRYQPLPATDTPRLLFVGSLDYFPNQDAVNFLLQAIMPIVWDKIPTTCLRVIGRNPTPQIKEWMRGDQRLELLVNAQDLTPLVADCSLSIVPLRSGGGTRLKILEAAAWGLPIISTPLGCEGLTLIPDVHLRVAEEATSLAAAIVELLLKPAERQRLGTAARQFVTQHYDWNTVLKPLEQSLIELVDENRRQKNASG